MENHYSYLLEFKKKKKKSVCLLFKKNTILVQDSTITF